MPETDPDTCPSGSKSSTGPHMPAERLYGTVPNIMLGRSVRTHGLRSKLRKRKRDERDEIRTSGRNIDVRATHEHLEQPQSQPQLPNGPLTFTTTVRVVFEDPSGSKGASNADEDFSAEDGTAKSADSCSALVGVPTHRRRYHQLTGVERDRQPWTEWEDNVLSNARRKGWLLDTIQRDLLPHRTYRAVESRSFFLRPIERASERWSPLTSSLSTPEGPLKPPLEEPFAVPSRWPCSSYRWTKSEDRALMGAYNQGLKYSLIQSEILPQRSVTSIKGRLARLRFHSTKANNDHGQHLFGAQTEATNIFLNSSAQDAKARATSWSRRKPAWTDEENTTFIRARDRGWSYARIRYELFPQRSLCALRARGRVLRRSSSNGNKSNTTGYRRYGVILKNEAVDDEEFPPLPKEADHKSIRQENMEEQDEMAQEEEHHTDYTSLSPEDNDEADERSPELGEGNSVVANGEHLALPEEEVGDMDTEVDDEDLPRIVSEDKEEVNDCILADAEDGPEDEAASEDECDDS